MTRSIGSWKAGALAVLALLLAVPVIAQTRYVVVSDRIAEVEAAARAGGGVVQHRLKYLNGSVVEMPDQAAAALKARFGANAIVEPDIEYTIALQPGARISKRPGGSTPPPQPEQTIPWGIVAVNAPGAWSSYTGVGIIVGVVDTGIQPDHPDLAANIVGGENFVMPRTGKPVIDPSKWADDNGHGTHVAGTVAAVDNEIGVVGVAPGAKLFAAKVLNSSGSGTLSGVADGIVACVENGVDVINLSLGGGDAEVLRLAVEYAQSQGVIVVAAAGNGGCECALYPSSYPGVLRISAIDSSRKLASFSNFGDIDYTAPGKDVPSTFIGSGYATYSGTSMAAPHAAGVVALMLAEGRNALYTVELPSLTEAQQGAGLVSAIPSETH